MLMRHLTLPLPMDTNSTDERNILAGGANMPVPYHLDESDSDSIVSTIIISSSILFSSAVFRIQRQLYTPQFDALIYAHNFNL